MAINFPSNPQLNQTYTEGNRSWQWNGRFWQATSVTVGYTGSKGDDGQLNFKGNVATEQDLPLPYLGEANDAYLVEETGFLWAWDGSSWGPLGRFTGYTGSQGPTGTSVRIVGSVNTSSELPIPHPGEIGDGYIVQDSGELWIWDGSSWGSIGRITGEIGPTGFTGSQGEGIIDAEIVGEDLIVTYQDSTQENLGRVLGYTGSQGPTGTSVRIVGSLATSSLLPTPHTGEIGDGYIVQDSGELWIWDGSSWGSIGRITGEIGPTGFTGSQGIRGAGIVDAEILGDDLVITYSDSTIENLGRVLGYTGSEGLGLDEWIKVTSNYTATSGNRIIADTTLASFTVTLPSNPTLGSYIVLSDGGNWTTNPLIIDSGTEQVEGYDEGVIFDIGGVTTELLYDGTMWQVTATLGAEGPPGAGFPAGGTQGQVLTKASGDDYDAAWQDPQSQVDSIDDLSDVTVTNPTAGQILGYTGSNWTNQTQVDSIDDLSDVTVTNPTAGQILGYTGSNWTNQTVETGGGGADSYVKTYFWEGALQENVSRLRYYIHVNSTLESITVNLGTAALTETTILIKKNNVALNSINIPANTIYVTTSVSHALAVNDFLTVDITKSSSAANLYVTFVYREG